MASSSNGSGGCLWIVVIIVGLLVWGGIGNNSHSNNTVPSSTSSSSSSIASSNNTKAYTSNNANSKPKLKAKKKPKNGAILSGSSHGYSGVRVKTSTGTCAYVKVKNGGKTLVSFFVRGGSSAEVRVPTGTYSVQFATGSKWYGKKHRFGESTSYGQDKSVTLGYGQQISYTLERVSNGNFSMSALDGSEF